MTDSAQRYRVVEKLESGGMAEVFRAESEGLQGFKKQVAIKRVLPHLSEKKKFIAMFLDEARLSAHLSHSNVVQVFDIGVGDSAYFIVMEFVDGANLKSVAESLKKQGRDFPVPSAVFIAHEICKGLAYAHDLRDPSGEALHLVHRDMSPPNVLITKFGEVKIVDFGLAKANSQLEKSEPGIIKGKFSYLSPEAALGQEVDARTDVFAVGIILWELLAGQKLFLGETDFQTVKKVQQAVIPPISEINKKAPLELEKILARALARDPAVRYQTARDLGRDLNRFLFAFGQPVSAFDVEELVHTTMKERQRKRPQQHSIIDKLIEEALLEFTSLKPDDKPDQTQRRNSQVPGPLDLKDFEDPSKWMNDAALKGLSRMPQMPPPQAPLDFSLSGLEDDAQAPAPGSGGRAAPGLPPLPPRRDPVHGASGNTGVPGGGGSQQYGQAPVQRAPESPRVPPVPGGPALSGSGGPSSVRGSPEKKGRTAVVGVVLAVAAAAAVVAAWFTNLIPHGR